MTGTSADKAAGMLRSIRRRVPYPLDAARLIETHRLVEAGGVAGKVVVARSAEDAERNAREAGR